MDPSERMRVPGFAKDGDVQGYLWPKKVSALRLKTCRWRTHARVGWHVHVVQWDRSERAIGQSLRGLISPKSSLMTARLDLLLVCSWETVRFHDLVLVILHFGVMFPVDHGHFQSSRELLLE